MTGIELLQKIKKYIGTPDFERDNVLLYQIDCLKALEKIPDNVIELTVTSPPYNIGKEYEKLMEVSQYIKWCSIWMNEVYRITQLNGSFWLNVGYLEVPGKGLAVPIPYLLWDKSPFYLLQEIVWNYGAGVACKKRFSPRNEKILWYVKNPKNYIFNLDAVRDPNVKYPNQKKNGKLKCNPLGKNPSDVWQIPKVTSGKNRASKERTPHPAQFPVQMIDRIIKACSNEGGLVLDPFIGSGTTAESAIKHSRCVIGFEINPSYIDIAISRIEDFIKRQQLSQAQKKLPFLIECFKF